LLCLLLSSASVGHADPYPRQPIDVEHYRFVLTVTDSSDRIVGDATVLSERRDGSDICDFLQRRQRGWYAARPMAQRCDS
jgi:hypothetical protein